MAHWPVHTIDSDADPVEYVITTTCPNCLEDHELGPFTAEQIDHYRADDNSRRVFPDMSIEDREHLSSGCCPTCYDELFINRSDDDDDELAEEMSLNSFGPYSPVEEYISGEY